MADLWIETFAGLRGLEPETRTRLISAARPVHLPAGSAPFRAGGACEQYLLVRQGRIRVQIVAESGREIVLYRVGAGETCVLTTVCLISGEDYPAEALAETDVDGVVVPRAVFRDLLGCSAAFRDFVFDVYGQRLASLLTLIEEVVFRRLDLRLADWLSSHSARQVTRLAATHQQIAVELGSAREVVSRQLKEFERRGWVMLSRGMIEITAPAELRRFAERDRV